VGFLSLRNLAILWTDRDVVLLGRPLQRLLDAVFHQGRAGLTFGAIFFFIMWGNLLLTDRFGARDLSFDPDDEVVRRFQNIVRPYAKRIYAAIALVMGHRRAQRHRPVEQLSALLPLPVLPQGRPALHKDLGFTSSRCPSSPSS
jgi:hypothetical protein